MDFKSAVSAIQHLAQPPTSPCTNYVPSTAALKQMRETLLDGGPELADEIQALSDEQIRVANHFIQTITGAEIVKKFRRLSREDPKLAAFIIRMAMSTAPTPHISSFYYQRLRSYVPLLTDAPEVDLSAIASMCVLTSSRDTFLRVVAEYLKRARVRGTDVPSKRFFVAACLNESWEYFIEQLDNGNIVLDDVTVTTCAAATVIRDAKISTKRVMKELLDRGAVVTGESIRLVFYLYAGKQKLQTATVETLISYASKKAIIDFLDSDIDFDLLPHSLHNILEQFVVKVGLDTPKNQLLLVRLTYAKAFWDHAARVDPCDLVESVAKGSHRGQVGSTIDLLLLPTKTAKHEATRLRVFTSLDYDTKVSVLSCLTVGLSTGKFATFISSLGDIPEKLLTDIRIAQGGRMERLGLMLSSPVTLEHVSPCSRDVIVAFLSKSSAA